MSPSPEGGRVTLWHGRRARAARSLGVPRRLPALPPGARTLRVPGGVGVLRPARLPEPPPSRAPADATRAGNVNRPGVAVHRPVHHPGRLWLLLRPGTAGDQPGRHRGRAAQPPGHRQPVRQARLHRHQRGVVCRDFRLHRAQLRPVPAGAERWPGVLVPQRFQFPPDTATARSHDLPPVAARRLSRQPGGRARRHLSRCGRGRCQRWPRPRRLCPGAFADKIISTVVIPE
jgi:hypothetical protein